jgi:hypothetical protein
MNFKASYALIIALCFFGANSRAMAKDLFCQDTAAVEDAGLKVSVEGSVAYLVEVTLVGERLLSNMSCTSTGAIADPDREVVLQNCSDDVSDAGYALVVKQSPYQGFSVDVYSKNMAGRKLMTTMICN